VNCAGNCVGILIAPKVNQQQIASPDHLKCDLPQIPPAALPFANLFNPAAMAMNENLKGQP
jgi:hypothetical protein